MKNKELFSPAERLESFSRGNEQEKSIISQARLLLLREIINRMKKIKNGLPLEKNEIREEQIEPFLNNWYLKKHRLQMTVARQGLENLLENLYRKPVRGESGEEANAKLKEIQKKIESYPEETLQEMVGVYLRMKERNVQKNAI